MAKRIKKIRVYSFGANNADTREHGTFNFTAKNMDRAETLRWAFHSDPVNPITCAGYVGPMDGGVWVPENEARLGFVSSDTLEAERRAAMPIVEHDPKMLAEFVERTGEQPKRGNVLKRNLLSQGVFEIHPDTSGCCDPSTETYHSM